MNNIRILSIVIIILLTACKDQAVSQMGKGPLEPNTNSYEETVSKTEENGTPYLSITMTDKQLQNHYYYYDLSKKSLEEAAVTKDTAQYPLGALDRKHNLLFYSEKVSTGGDQLMMLDLKTGEKKQLTTELFAINSIIPIWEHEKVILAAVDKVKSAVQIYGYDHQSGKLTNWFPSDNDDTSVESLHYHASTGKLYAVLFSDQERDKLTDKANLAKAADVKASPHWVMEYDMQGKALGEVYRADEKISFFVLSQDKKFALIRSAPTVFQAKKIYVYDMGSGSKQELDSKGLSSIQFASFSPNPDQEGFYFTGIVHSMEEPGKITGGPPNSLYFYELKSGKISRIFGQDSMYINNFILLQ
ncbi:hypothetical protein [Paenibacillus turpanensis]|uniref:hypothetical protein n=1 Tax=Paenibacillus turpanensis TaxID=2689078 RepID=UPI0014096803|nr:hypothetical protein [Paenibacillus turpanensis]